MHHIQKTIINNLAHASPLRFSELQPQRIPNNTFSYHLKKLLETGYVALTTEGYVATRKALKTLSYNDNEKRSISRPAVLTILFVTNEVGEVLLIKRRTQPFKNHFGFPSGLIHGSETIEQAARRELYEKTSIIAEVGMLRQGGVLDFRYQEKVSNDIFIHAIGFIYTYVYHGNSLAISDLELKYGDLRWSKLDHADILPEAYKISQIVTEGGHTVHSVNFDEPLGDTSITPAHI